MMRTGNPALNIKTFENMYATGESSGTMTVMGTEHKTQMQTQTVTQMQTAMLTEVRRTAIFLRMMANVDAGRR